MDAQRERALFRLLGGTGRLSRPEKEAILADVLATVERPAVARRSHWWAIVFACAVAAALVLVLRSPREPVAEENDVLVPRGLGDAAPQLAILCGDRPLAHACSIGNELGFEAAALGGLHHLAMYAKGEDGTVIWYLPATADGRSLALDAAHETVLVGQRVTLGPEHTPGRYRLVAVFSAQPLDRDAVKDVILGRTPRSRDIAVVERDLWIE